MKTNQLKKRGPESKKASATIGKKTVKSIPNGLAFAIIILLGIIIYSNSFNCAFQFDDTPNIIQNKIIRTPSDIKSIWNYDNHRFAPLVSFAINYHFGGLKVWGYHLVNLIIHLINSCLVWWITLLFLSSPAVKEYSVTKHKHGLAFIVALLFVSHPLATESVTYIVQRMASLCAMFYFCSLAFYLKARLTEKTRLIKYSFFTAAIITGILALISKENSYTLPFAIILVELCFLQTKNVNVSLKDYRLWIVVLAFIGFIAFTLSLFSFSVLNPLPPSTTTDFRTITPTNYLLSQFSVIVRYIQLLFIPLNLNLDYDYPLSESIFDVRVIINLVVLLFLFILSILLFKKNRIISFGIFWFFLTLSIESSIIPIDDLIFEHRTYIPSLGFFLIFGTSIFVLLWEKYKYFAISIILFVIFSNSMLTYKRNKIWETEYSLMTDIISKSPNKSRPYCNRGLWLSNQNRYSEALIDLNKSIELCAYNPMSFNNRGKIYAEINRKEEAEIDFSKAIELDTNFSQAFNNRGKLFTDNNEYEKALIDLNKAISLDTQLTSAYVNRGYIYILKNNTQEALRDLNRALLLDPQNPLAYLNRGLLSSNQNKYEEAILDFNAAINLNKNYAMAYFNRGAMEFNLGKKEDACNDWQKAASMGYQQATETAGKLCN